MLEKSISILGLGKMGSAIAKTLVNAGYEVNAYDVSPVKVSKKIILKESMDDLLQKKMPILLAVKPDQIASSVYQIVDNRLIISIAAGVSIHTLDGHRKVPGPTVRAMPNAAITVKAAITALYANSMCSDDQKDFARDIFATGGETLFIDREDQMHAITALSGSGPAFIELFMQSLEDGGVLMGLSRGTARTLVKHTVHGVVELVKKTGLSPQELMHDVTSPGGTTVAGLQMLKDYNLERAVLKAIQKAAQRSKELGE